MYMYNLGWFVFLQTNIGYATDVCKLKDICFINSLAVFLESAPLCRCFIMNLIQWHEMNKKGNLYLYITKKMLWS